MKFGDILAELRKDKGILQKDLAFVLNVSVSTISNYETNAHFPDIHTLLKLSDYFKVSIDYLLGRTAHNFYYKEKQTTDEIKLLHLVQKHFAYDEATKKSFLHYLECLESGNKERI